MSHRPLAALLAVLTAWPAHAGTPAANVTCTNTFSRATWRIAIDYSRATVDTYPARITPGIIAWHDLHDGFRYRLDRASGELTAVAASSTGGYFLHDRCDLKR